MSFGCLRQFPKLHFNGFNPQDGLIHGAIFRPPFCISQNVLFGLIVNQNL